MASQCEWIVYWLWKISLIARAILAQFSTSKSEVYPYRSNVQSGQSVTDLLHRPSRPAKSTNVSSSHRSPTIEEIFKSRLEESMHRSTSSLLRGDAFNLHLRGWSYEPSSEFSSHSARKIPLSVQVQCRIVVERSSMSHLIWRHRALKIVFLKHQTFLERWNSVASIRFLKGEARRPWKRKRRIKINHRPFHSTFRRNMFTH